MVPDSMDMILVEDSADDAGLVLRVLHEQGITGSVRVLRNGAEVLDYFFGAGTPAAVDTDRLPRVLVLDLKLPLVNGLEVLQRLKSDERTRSIPVVVFTSSAEDCDVQAGYRLGANSYVVKPVDFDEFAEAVRQLSVYWLALNTAPSP